jgi:hypothetical protein
MSQPTAIPINITLTVRTIVNGLFVWKLLRGHDLLFHLTNDPRAATANNSNAFEIKTLEH